MRGLAVLLLAVALGACTRPAAGPLAAYRGQWLVINYWASWCKPCIQEVPELNALAEAHADIRVLGVNFDGLTGEVLAAEVERLGIAFATIDDPAPALGTARPEVLPSTLVLDPDGQLLATLVGPQTGHSLLQAMGKEQTP